MFESSQLLKMNKLIKLCFIRHIFVWLRNGFFTSSFTGGNNIRPSLVSETQLWTMQAFKACLVELGWFTTVGHVIWFQTARVLISSQNHTRNIRQRVHLRELNEKVHQRGMMLRIFS